MPAAKNRAFEDDDGEEPRNGGGIHEIPTISGKTQTDGFDISNFTRKITAGLDINTFATRKTIAQGMLDLALLTANAAQLKRILTIGPVHKFYTLLVTLITISICLQVVQAVIMCILAIVFDLSKVEQHQRTNIANNILLLVTTISVAINILISTFDIADIK